MIVDKLGNAYGVGNYIVYGHALGRCAGLRVGKVLKITESVGDQWGRAVPVYRVTVRGIDDDWSSGAPALCSKNGTLHYPNRTIVIDEDELPEAYLALFNSLEESV